GFLLATANLGPIARSWGLSAAAVTLAATLSPLANGTSRIFWGWASDKTGRENAMIIAFALNALCLLLVLKLGQWSGAWFAFSLVGAPLLPPSPTASAGQVGQGSGVPTNNLPNPYRTIANYFTLPDGREWGSTSAVEIDKDGRSIWVAERCGSNSCAGSN